MLDLDASPLEENGKSHNKQSSHIIQSYQSVPVALTKKTTYAARPLTTRPDIKCLVGSAENDNDTACHSFQAPSAVDPKLLVGLIT